MRSTYKCLYCDLFSTRRWNRDKHMERKHGIPMPKSTSQTQSRIDNFSPELINNPRNSYLPNYDQNDTDESFFRFYSKLNKNISVYNSQISLIREIKSKIEQVDSHYLPHLINSIMQLQSRRNNINGNHYWGF
jgi:hypothetical protein